MVRVELDVFGIVLPASNQINLVRDEVETLMSEHQPHLLGTGRESVVIELNHFSVPPRPENRRFKLDRQPTNGVDSKPNQPEFGAIAYLRGNE